ncbi:MAG: flavodoxin family protein [Rhodobacteraceae bacterium]|nr:flavodoxin family protein [Paracoccaceae bacterium]
MDRSEINGPMYKAAAAIEGITCVDLYAEYPTFEIDVDREQARLTSHDAIVFLHPLYWYSVPALVKEWMDLVLEYGFAYGHEGHALDKKVMFNAVSCGATEAAYQPAGANGAHLRDLLAPIEKSADLCRMRFLAPFTIYAAGRAKDEGRDLSHLAAWAGLLRALRDDELDIDAARRALELNDIAATCVAPSEAV